MGGKGSGKKAKQQPAAATKPLPAQGTGGQKRTPQSAFDGAAGKDVYEPEKIIAERLAKMVKQYFAAPASSAGVERVFRRRGRCMMTSRSQTRMTRSRFRCLR